ALSQPERERKALPDTWPRWHGHDPVDVGIAGQNAGGILEHENIDHRSREGATQARDQRRRKKHVSEPAQRHHQNARTGRQIERFHRFGDGERGGESSGMTMRSSCNTAPPNTPTAKMYIQAWVKSIKWELNSEPTMFWVTAIKPTQADSPGRRNSR